MVKENGFNIPYYHHDEVLTAINIALNINHQHKTTIDKVIELIEKTISNKIEFLKAQGLIQPEHHIGELTDLIIKIKQLNP